MPVPLQSASFSAPGTPTSAAATYGTNLGGGNKLIALVVATLTTTSTVKDGSGNSFTKLASIGLNNSTTTGEISLWAVDTPAGDAGTKPTITATYAGTSGGGGILIQEVPGLLAGNTTAMLDGTAGTNAGTESGGASQALTSPTYSSTASGEYLVACFADDGASGANTYTVPGGYTGDTHNINSTGVSDLGLAYKNSTHAAESGGYTVNVGTSVTNNYGQILVAFKLAPSGGTAPSLLLVPPGLQSPMSLSVPSRPATSAPPPPVTAVASPPPLLVPPGLQSPMSLGVPATPPRFAVPPAPQQQPVPAPAPVPPGLQSPMALAVPARFSIPPAPQQQPAPAPAPVPPGLQSPMSLGVPARPATAAPPAVVPPGVSVPPPLLTPPGLQSPMSLTVPARPATAAPPAPPVVATPGAWQPHPPGLQSPMAFGLPLYQPPQGAPPPGPPGPTPPIPSGVVPFAQGAPGGDRPPEIRMFRSVMPGEIPATGHAMPRLQGRGYAAPPPARADDVEHPWEEPTEPPAPPGPTPAEIMLGEAQRAAGALYDLGKILAPEPYVPPSKARCGAIRKLGTETLRCTKKRGHPGMHADRGVRWG